MAIFNRKCKKNLIRDEKNQKNIANVRNLQDICNLKY